MRSCQNLIKVFPRNICLSRSWQDVSNFARVTRSCMIWQGVSSFVSLGSLICLIIPFACVNISDLGTKLFYDSEQIRQLSYIGLRYYWTFSVIASAIEPLTLQVVVKYDYCLVFRTMTSIASCGNVLTDTKMTHFCK